MQPVYIDLSLILKPGVEYMIVQISISRTQQLSFKVSNTTRRKGGPVSEQLLSLSFAQSETGRWWWGRMEGEGTRMEEDATEQAYHVLSWRHGCSEREEDRDQRGMREDATAYCLCVYTTGAL
ncbi:hypothetical protein PoB_003651300 [Plakobranchus ocellatus]|uniref:Uncharacterized protein n=1 Tax=Plakobranchus ocellatus TaxID=259542 RepID=A0AAV4AT77_9GAST|nr:hypothetical protein PoB_003651300 [Plakobranchus ocellatus]